MADGSGPSDAGYDPLALGHMADPCPAHRWLRTEEPTHRSEKYSLWVLSRYQDISQAARDVTRFSNATPSSGLRRLRDRSQEILAGAPSDWPAVPTLLTTDPPEHTHNRRVINAAFSPRRVAGYEKLVREVAAALVETLVGRTEVDLLAEFAVPLPMTVITRILGLPSEEVPTLKRWSDSMATLLSAELDEEAEFSAVADMREWFDYIAEQVEDRRRRPREDFLSDLATVEREDGRQLTTAEVISMANQSLVAGNETTTSLISWMLLRLAQDPDLRVRLQREPDLSANMVEESLRFLSPVQGLYRRTTCDVDVNGVTIPAGERVQLLWGSANHDPAEFDEPEVFDVDRENARRHLAFGSGPHFCPGATLARLEARVALELLVPRLERLELPEDFTAEWNDHFHLRALRRLPMTIDVRAAR